jgi:3-phenylpropionate/trans-cinnamate dioxygenase ferredoxin reductase subunit
MTFGAERETKMAEQLSYYVLVGGGLASATAAETIRKYDKHNTILIIANEGHNPYNRPPLSKEFLRGEAGESDVLIHPASWYEEHQVTLLSSSQATAIDTKAQQVTLANGDQVHYQKLLLATGAAPKTLALPGIDLPNVHVLRTWDDSDRLKDHQGQKIVIIGGGYIGVEVAADFVQKGGQATIVEPTDHLWSKFASPQFGEFLKKKLEKAGVEIILQDEAIEVIATGLKTKQGRTLSGDLVLVAVGVKPNLELAKAAGLEVDEEKNGVLVNEYLETGTPNIWAAGDIAGFYDPVLGKRWRVEHYNNAQWHGEIAGANMAGQRVAYDHVANFFSDELDIHFELYGDPQGGKGGLFHGLPESDRFDELYVNEDGQAVMVISVNPPEDLLETLEKIPRVKPVVRGREREISQAGFDLASLL